jgi:hypothetical protein
MPAASGALNPPQAKTVDARIAIVPIGSTTRPTRATLTNSAADVDAATEGTAANVTMTLASDPGTLNIQVGQYLQFIDSSGNKYLARVRTTFASGTSLALEIWETIPANSTAVFPARFNIRQSFSFSESVSTNTFSSFDHTTSTVSIGEGTGSVTADGGYSFYDAGGWTAKYAKDNSLKVWIESELESPDSSVFGSGDFTGAIGVVTSIDQTAQDGDSVLSNFSFDIQEVVRTKPAT